MQQDSVMIHLCDFHDQFLLFSKLKSKFLSQQFYKLKYLQAKQLQYDYIPIEFIHDEEFLSRHFEYFPKLCPPSKMYLLKDRNFILKSIKNVSNNIPYNAFYNIFLDSSYALELVKANPHSFTNLTKFQKNRQIVLAALKQKPELLKFLDEDLRNDFEIVMEAVKAKCETANFNVLKYASGDLKKDDRIVMAAVERDGLSLSWASDRLCRDKRIILTAVKQNGLSLASLEDRFKNDREIVIQAIRNQPSALTFASKELKDDFQVVKEVVDSGRIDCLSYASSRLLKTDFQHICNDRDLILQFIRKSKIGDLGDFNFSFISRKLRRDKQFILEAMEMGVSLKYFDYSDSDILFLAMKNGDFSLRLNESICTDSFLERVLHEIIPLNPPTLSILPKSILNSKEFALKALKINGLFIKYLSDSMRKDKDIIQQAMNQNVASIQFLDYRKDLALRAVQVDGMLYNMKKWGYDYQVFLEAVKQNGRALKDLELFDEDIEVLRKEAIKQCGYFNQYSNSLYYLRMETCYDNCKI